MMFNFQNVQKVSLKEEPAFTDRECLQLIKSIDEARRELDSANENFAYVTDPLLVDAYAYQIKSAQAKYSYLLSRAKRIGITKNNLDYLKRSDV